MGEKGRAMSVSKPASCWSCCSINVAWTKNTRRVRQKLPVSRSNGYFEGELRRTALVHPQCISADFAKMFGSEGDIYGRDDCLGRVQIEKPLKH